MDGWKKTSRRSILKGAAVAGVAVAAPFVVRRATASNGSIAVRTLGGAYEEAANEAIFKPFTQETGIEVRLVPANYSKLLAMHRSGAAELDVIDIGELGIVDLGRAGALEAIDYDSWSSTNPNDLDVAATTEFATGHTYYSTVLGYNSEVFPEGKGPQSWADFWDAQAFPGPRTLADIAAGSVDLEIALLADGVAPEDIYPIDIERALSKMADIRPQVRKFWDTGALSAQMLIDEEAVMGTIWNTRLQVAIDKGAPLAIQWNQGMLHMQTWAILKGSPNPEGAQKFIEFAVAPERQAKLCEMIPNGPTNSGAFEFISPERADILPSKPEYAAKQFVQDAVWWADNRETVSREWSKWLLSTR